MSNVNWTHSLLCGTEVGISTSSSSDNPQHDAHKRRHIQRAAVDIIPLNFMSQEEEECICQRGCERSGGIGSAGLSSDVMCCKIVIIGMVQFIRDF